MKKNTHPSYQDVLFVDTATGTEFVCGSTLAPKEKQTYQGKEYPVCRVPVSSASHPFFTKTKQFIDAEGRVDKFTKRYEKKRQETLEKKEAPVKKATRKKKP